MAAWLNETFFGFDKAILSFYHYLAEVAGGVLTPVMEFITIIGEKGAIVLLIGFIMLLFAKSRKTGCTVFAAVIFGALFTNIILKDIIARPRPFESVELFNEWWRFVGAFAEDGFSFPSGHVTAVTAGFMAMVFTGDKRYCAFAIPSIILMAASRNYLIGHYPTDVIAAMIVGTVSATLAYITVKYIWRFIEAKREVKLFSFFIEFDIKNLFKKKSA